MILPHRIVRVTTSQYKSAGGDLGQLLYGDTRPTFKANIQAMSQEAAYSIYQKEISRPHIAYLSVRDAKGFDDQDIVIFGTRRFRVMAPPTIQEHGLSTDHGTILLQELDHAPV